MEPIYSVMHPSTGKILRPNNQTWDIFELVDNTNPLDRRWKVTVAGATIGTLNVNTLCEAWPELPTRKADSIIVCSTVGGTPKSPNIQPTAIPLRIIAGTGELVVYPALNFETGDIEPLRMYNTTPAHHRKGQIVFGAYNASLAMPDMLNIYTESAAPLVEPDGLGCMMWQETNSAYRIMRAHNHTNYGVAQRVFTAYDNTTTQPSYIPIQNDGFGGGAGAGILAMGYKDSALQRNVLRIDNTDNLKVQDYSNKTAPAVYNITLPQNVIVTVPISFLAPGLVKAYRMRIRLKECDFHLGYVAGLPTYETVPKDQVIIEEDLRTPGFNAYVRQVDAPDAILELTLWA